jgi:hypothetical protein
MEHFNLLITTRKYQICIHEEIKCRLNSGNTCYHSVQNFLSSSLLPKNIKTKIYRTIIFHVVLCECKRWSLTLREKHRRRVPQNWVLIKIYGLKRDKVTGDWRSLHNELPFDLYSSLNIIRVIKSRRMLCSGHEARMG